jgi:hypothetical protein
MTGLRATTTGSIDRQFDTYATIGYDKVRIIAGVRLTTGNYSIEVSNLDAVHLPPQRRLSLKTWVFVGTSVWDIITSPVDGGTREVQYEGNKLVITIAQNDTYTGWAFEFDV